MMAGMGKVVDLLNRPTYGLAQVDRLLGLPGGTARRWIDGYERAGKRYPPVVRESSTGDEIATWGEFVETRLLSEYRDAGVPLLRMRPAVRSAPARAKGAVPACLGSHMAPRGGARARACGSREGQARLPPGSGGRR